MTKTTVLNLRTLTMTFLLYLTSICVFALLGATVLDWSKYQDLARHSVRTVGNVTAKEPDNHNFIRYSFSVDHNLFSGVGNAGGENPSFDDLKVGDPVTVYYDPNNPDNSFLGDPKRQAASATAGLIFITVFGSLLTMFGLYVKRWLPIFS